MSKKRPFVLGLTGSIGMGKSTTAGFFVELGIPVWDADSAVHRLYANGGAAVTKIAQVHPSAIVDGGVDRGVLREWIATDDTAIKKLEAVVHPLVAQDRQAFIAKAQNDGADLVVVDVPLLFETGGDAYVDATLVVSAPAEVQKARVLARDNMNAALFEKILASQMPDKDKRAKADYVIQTTSISDAKQAVQALLLKLSGKADENA